MNHIRQILLFAGMAWVAGMCFSLTASAQAPDEAPAKEKPGQAGCGKPAAGKRGRGREGECRREAGQPCAAGRPRGYGIAGLEPDHAVGDFPHGAVAA